MERVRRASETQVLQLAKTRIWMLKAAGRPEKNALAIKAFVKSLGRRMTCTQCDSKAFVQKTREKLKKFESQLRPAVFVFKGLAHAVGESHVDWMCEELAAKGGLDNPQTETPEAKAKVVEEADDQAATPASQAHTPIPMSATTPGSTATTSTVVGQEEQDEEEATLSQSPKSTISRKRKKTTTSTPQARLARALGPSSQGSVAFGSDLPRRRSQRPKK